MNITKKAILLIIIILIIDQVLKVWIKTSMLLGQEIHVFGDWFIIHFTENKGMAFGMNIPGNYGKIILTLFRIAAVIGISFYLRYLIKHQSHPGLILSISLILAGALGNIVDSVFYGVLFSESYTSVAEFLPEEGGYAPLLQGRVVDMFYFPIIKATYPDWFPFWKNQTFIFFRPVFNIADSAITVGVFIILIFQKRFFKVEESSS